MKRGTILLLALGLIGAGCAASKKGVRTIGAPSAPGETSMEFKFHNVDPKTFAFSLQPADAASGRSISQGANPEAVPAKPAVAPAKEIPAWLIRNADAGDPVAVQQLAAWMLELQRRKP